MGRLGEIKRGFWGAMIPLSRWKAAPALGLAALALALTLITTASVQRISAELAVGTIAPRDIKADRNYEIVDEEATQKSKEEAAAGILPVFDFDPRVAEEAERRIHDAFEAARARLEEFMAMQPASRAAEPDAATAQETAEIFDLKLGVAPQAGQVKSLMYERMSPHAEAFLADVLRRAMSRPLVAERASLDAWRGKGVVVRSQLAASALEAGERPPEEVVGDVGRIGSVDEARDGIAKLRLSGAGFRDRDSAAALAQLASLLVQPNCSFNRAESERRREEAAAGVPDMILKVKAGEMIVREGSRLEPSQIKILRGIQREGRGGAYSQKFSGAFLLALICIIAPFYLVEKFFRRGRASYSDHVLMALVGLAALGLARLSFTLAPPLHDAFFFNISRATLGYMVPAAFGAMLVRMFLGAEITLAFSIALGLACGFFAEAPVRFSAFCLVVCIAATAAIADADRRGKILKAGLASGAVGALAVAGISLVGMASGSSAMRAPDLAWGMAFAVAGGLGAAVLAMMAAPAVEALGGYTSDIKLLELANLNHPLLRELIVRAPGTYHHSHMVGIMGEAAAEAIGARALLVRVGAYYHDIGKLKKPSYFIENTKPGEENRHDRLSPHMSALIVAAHIKEGEELAAAGGIPKAITDMIPQHHGTRLIGYFYEKAKASEEAASQKVDPKDFRYAGPKPQTREAAILMLADAAEAAVRALKEKGTARIQQTVQRVITDIFMEEQLDECELTLKDLREIGRAFMRILLGIYHARIEYPKEAGEEGKGIAIAAEAAGSLTPPKRPPQH